MLRSVNRLKSFVTTFRIVSVHQNLNFICFSAEPIIFNVFFFCFFLNILFGLIGSNCIIVCNGEFVDGAQLEKP